MWRVCIIEVSPQTSPLIRDILRLDSNIEVAEEREYESRGLENCKSRQPDVIIVNIEPHHIKGLALVEDIMINSPQPIVVSIPIDSKPSPDFLKAAVKAGALAVVLQPLVPSREDPATQNYLNTVKAMADVKVVGRRPWLLRDRSPDISKKKTGPLGTSGVEVITIGASTGGPPALQVIFQDLNADFPVPILVVQHISPGFVSGLVSWLDSSCEITVKVFQSGSQLQPGTVYFAPDDLNLVFTSKTKLSLQDSKPTRGHRPSIDLLFSSTAKFYRNNGVGVLLTGMGEDGARGLLEMLHTGAHTIVQDQKTCAVYGMPKAAATLGAASEELPLEAIATRLATLVGVLT